MRHISKEDGRSLQQVQPADDGSIPASTPPSLPANHHLSHVFKHLDAEGTSMLSTPANYRELLSDIAWYV